MLGMTHSLHFLINFVKGVKFHVFIELVYTVFKRNVMVQQPNNAITEYTVHRTTKNTDTGLGQMSTKYIINTIPVFSKFTFADFILFFHIVK